MDELGFDHVIVTGDQQTYDDLVKKNAFVVLENEKHPIRALREAGLDNASMIITAYEKDSANLLVILAVRKIRPDIRIVSVVNDEELMEAAKRAGADATIPASTTVGHLLALSAVTKDLVGVVYSEKTGTKEIAEFSSLQNFQAYR